MGTRSLTMVIDQDGQTKIAQYGQFDGYPSGVGVGVLKFLQDKELTILLKNKLSIVRFLDAKGKDKDFFENYNKNAPEWSSQPDNRTPEQIKWFESYIHRNICEEILTKVAESDDSEIILINNEQTAKEDGWVEWSYVINFKENTLNIHYHIDTPPIKIYQLDQLPTKEVFIDELENNNEE
ncbi:MAG: hypothetical protein LBE34_12800 [Flavobacteriaceae bacterium]|jgi:uncharacterized surface anchored protein|nr:hypothetical protein [Flavobacteriaceae bacterium]